MEDLWAGGLGLHVTVRGRRKSRLPTQLLHGIFPGWGGYCLDAFILLGCPFPVPFTKDNLSLRDF